MKKALVILLSLVFLMLTFSACGGYTEGHRREIIGNTLYSIEEIKGIMDIAEKQFKETFDGCELKLICYDEEFSLKRADGWKKQYNAEDAMVLKSNFYVRKDGGNGSLNPNSTYENWQWIFIKENGFWTLKTWGYG